MPYARNALDGNQVYFEDAGGNGAAVVLHGGLVDSVDLVRARTSPRLFRSTLRSSASSTLITAVLGAATNLTRWRHMLCSCVRRMR